MLAWTTGAFSGYTGYWILDSDLLTTKRMLKDDRVRPDQEKSIFNFRDISDRMG